MTSSPGAFVSGWSLSDPGVLRFHLGWTGLLRLAWANDLELSDLNRSRRAGASPEVMDGAPHVGAASTARRPRKFAALERHRPPGTRALEGVGNGVLEISEDLVGFEYLAYMQADDPELFAQLYHRRGDLMVGIWQRFLAQYAESFTIRRRATTLASRRAPWLVSRRTIRQHI